MPFGQNGLLITLMSTVEVKVLYIWIQMPSGIVVKINSVWMNCTDRGVIKDWRNPGAYSQESVRQALILSGCGGTADAQVLKTCGEISCGCKSHYPDQ